MSFGNNVYDEYRDSFGIGGMGGSGPLPYSEADPIQLTRGPGEGIKGSPYFKFADAIVKTVASYFTYGATTGMAMSAWKKALTTGDTSQGKLMGNGVSTSWGGSRPTMSSSGVGGAGGSGVGNDIIKMGFDKAKPWLEKKIEQLRDIEKGSKTGGAGPQGTALLDRYASGGGGQGTFNPYTGTWEKDLAQWRQDFGLGPAGTAYDSSNPWASLIGGESAGSGFDSGGGYGIDNMDWTSGLGSYGGDFGGYSGGGDWFNSGAGYGIDNMDWTSGLSDFSDYTSLFDSFGGV
jgi:hypothetical protein